MRRVFEPIWRNKGKPEQNLYDLTFFDNINNKNTNLYSPFFEIQLEQKAFYKKNQLKTQNKIMRYYNITAILIDKAGCKNGFSITLLQHTESY